MYSFFEIAQVLEGEIQIVDDGLKINHIVIDSRKIYFPSSSLFFCIEGEIHDGHKFIEQSIEKGVQAFVVSKSYDCKKYPMINFIKVDNTLDALQKIASYHRSKFSIPVIGITGSNGKTIVKDWIHYLLSKLYVICKSPKSYNSQVGVPLSVWELEEKDQVGIFEAGISKPHEMVKLEMIISPTIGIFTTIGSAHEENFISVEHKIEEKLKLFTNSKTIIVSSQYKQLIDFVKSKLPSIRIVSWGNDESDIYKIQTKAHPQSTDIFATDGNENFHFHIPYTDKASIENSIHSFIASIEIIKQKNLSNIEMNKAYGIIQELSSSLPSPQMRLSFKNGKNGCYILDDSYSNDFDSLKIALDTLNQLHQYKEKTLILSDFPQLKGNPSSTYKKLADIILSNKISKFIGIGNDLMNHRKLFSENASFYLTTQDFLNHIHDQSFYHEAILLKGGRSFEFEKISSRLQHKTHETVLAVNLNSIVHNLNYFRKKLHTNTKIMCMIKASGYGTGTHEIAHLLHYHHVHYLGVAYADEAFELRSQGIQTPIMIMNPENTHWEQFIYHKLEPVIYSLESLWSLIDYVKHAKKSPSIHIEFDTGMHRLGFNKEDIKELISALKTYPEIKIQSIFSHLAAADEQAADLFTNQQIQEFKEIGSWLKNELKIEFTMHIANSAATSRFPNAEFDMVRLGVGLYGIGVNREEQEYLKDVIKMTSSITQIRRIKKGESVSYARSFIAPNDMVIATVPVGYADGYRRTLSNGNGTMYINGKPAKVVGRVCMDMTMIDITDIDCSIGDEVEIIGENVTIYNLAEQLNTIPYEILTSISNRVKRIYIQD